MAYAALVSLLQTTEQMLNLDPYLIPCPKKQIQSFQDTIGSFIRFLDNCSPNDTQTVNNLVTKIRDAAYEAEDVFESLITNHFRRNSGSKESGLLEVLPQSLEKVMAEIESIKKDVKKVEDGSGGIIEQRVSTSTGLSRSAASGTKTLMTLDDDLVRQIMEQLVGDRSKLDIIPIVGMGGIGKTTLAKTLFNNTSIGKKFDIRAWVTVSQEYNVRDIVLHLLDEVGQVQKSQSDTEDLKLHLYKHLCSRRYLIVVDDVWNIKAWDDIKMLFPDTKYKSRIMLTSRQSEVASHVSTNGCHQLKLLNADVSWSLFCQELFGKDGCPSDLVEIGKQIAESCKGLPLAISVTCGILSKANVTKEYWEYVAQNLKSVFLSNDEQCLEILSLSYKYLPHRLKACFLYFGVFPEDAKMRVSRIVELWVAEGFLKPESSKSMEEVGEEYLNDLIDRNLILVHKYGSYGKPKTCIMHDLLRDVCLREAQEEKFLYVLNRYVQFDPAEAITQRRLSVHPNVINGEDESPLENDIEDLCEVVRSMPLIRSFACRTSFLQKLRFYLRLVKVYDVAQTSRRFPDEILELVNLRCLVLRSIDEIPSSITRLKYLQTFRASTIYRPSEFKFWEMQQLRHLRFQYYSFQLPDAKHIGKGVPNNLLTLSGVRNFKCTEEIITRFPKLRKLRIQYGSGVSDWSCFSLNNLVNLRELESLTLSFWNGTNETLMPNLCFPSLLKKLVLGGCRIPWKHVSIFGKLPNLQVLKLGYNACKGPVWEPNEEEFMQLTFLLIEKPKGLVEWRAEMTHFPSLRHLVLRECKDLEEIPSDLLGNPTLDIVELDKCRPEAESSAMDTIGEDSDVKLIIYPRKEADDESTSSDSDDETSDN